MPSQRLSLLETASPLLQASAAFLQGLCPGPRGLDAVPQVPQTKSLGPQTLSLLGGRGMPCVEFSLGSAAAPGGPGRGSRWSFRVPWAGACCSSSSCFSDTPSHSLSLRPERRPQQLDTWARRGSGGARVRRHRSFRGPYAVAPLEEPGVGSSSKHRPLSAQVQGDCSQAPCAVLLTGSAFSKCLLNKEEKLYPGILRNTAWGW